jgi:hypothetical protein
MDANKSGYIEPHPDPFNAKVAEKKKRRLFFLRALRVLLRGESMILFNAKTLPGLTPRVFFR